MDFSDRIAQLSARILKQKDNCLTEEAAKTAFVLPFLQALGYDVFDPSEVRPEFVSDVGTKKGEKVDYAICSGDDVQILIECKPIGAKLEIEHAGQLYRYFSVTAARFAVLTDGVRYCFYTDLDAPNRMDQRPFLVFNVTEFKASELTALKRFAKDAFDIDAILSTAEDLKYQRALADELRREFATPSDDFVRIIATRVYTGRMTQAVAEKFRGLLERAVQDYVRERVDSRLKGALEAPSVTVEPEGEIGDVSDDGIVTTDEEIDAFKIIRAIAAETVDPTRVVMRDGKSYCAILFDDNNRKPIARLHFNNLKRLAIEIFDEKPVTKTRIDSPVEIYSMRDRVRTALLQYISDNAEAPAASAAATDLEFSTKSVAGATPDTV